MTKIIIPSSDPRLGRHVNHDPRSRRYAFRAPGIDLVSTKHTRFIGVFDQGDLGSCPGNAGMGNLGTGVYYFTVDDLIFDWSQSAAVQLYSDATQIDEWEGSYPPVDTGSSGLAVAKVLKSRGWVSGYLHTFSFEDMQGALQFGPVMLGINWYTSFFYPDANGVVSIGNSSVAGGHEVVVDEIDMERELIGCTNSWGPDWGLGGRFYITFKDMARLLSEYGDVVVLVPNTAPEPTPAPVEEEEIVVPEEKPVVVDDSPRPTGPWYARLWRAIVEFFTTD